MEQERRSKTNQDRQQRARRQAQEASSAHQNSSSSSAATGSDPPYQGTPQPSSPSSSSRRSVSVTNAESPIIDRDGSPHASSEYTHRADAYPPPHFSIPTRRQFVKFDYLRQRTYEHTRQVDFPTLQALGVYEPFLHLTGRVGFSPTFWEIQRDSYNELTLEFLSSLALCYGADDMPYLRFHMRGTLHRVALGFFRELFGFHTEPQTTTLDFRVGYDKDHFWRLITGMEVATSNQYRSVAIPHPTLRIIQRALACTIFARGETGARANEEDLKLMDFMLRPDQDLERPDLMLFMVYHWLSVQQNTRTGGVVRIGAYVTLIAEELGVSFAGLTLSTGFSVMDARAYQRGTFLKISRGPAGHAPRLLWRLQNGTHHELPIDAPISFDDESTWLFTGAAPAPSPPLHPSHPPTDDIHMADTFPSHAGPSSFPAGPTPFSAGASTSYAGPTYPPAVEEPTISDVYRLMYNMRDEQGRTLYAHGQILTDLQRRMGDLEDQLRAWWLDPSP